MTCCGAYQFQLEKFANEFDVTEHASLLGGLANNVVLSQLRSYIGAKKMGKITTDLPTNASDLRKGIE
jgi:hypothetical protein